MTPLLRIFTDSDVVIASMLSKSGAAYFLMQSSYVETVVTTHSLKEIGVVAHRLNIVQADQKKILNLAHSIILPITMKEAQLRYNKFVNDLNDSHIVAGAVSAGVRFLITYNLKDFQIENIKREFDIIVLTPGALLQYLRSKDAF